MSEAWSGHEKPPDFEFVSLLHQWTHAVGRWFVWLEMEERQSERPSHARVSDCWVDDEVALVVLFTVSGHRVGLRLDRLDVDLLTGHPISAETPTRLASQQAFNVRDGTLFGPGDAPSWSDPTGRVWHGSPPAAGWESATYPTSRCTVLLSDEDVLGPPPVA